jgi:pilus assembly protein CpaB
VKARRRRGLLLLSLALASGGLAASQVREHERSVEARVGPLVAVVVAARDLPADARIRPGTVELRRVPSRFVPPDALGSASEATGARTAVPVVAGTYLTASHVRAAGRARSAGGSALGRGERAVEVAVSGGSSLTEVAPGVRVDVVVSSEPHAGGGRTFLALEDVELLGVRGDPGAAGYGGAAAGGDEPPRKALATLRVSLRQAVYLTAADNFGRELRLLVRPPGDRLRAGRAQVGEGEL